MIVAAILLIGFIVYKAIKDSRNYNSPKEKGGGKSGSVNRDKETQ